MPTRKQAVAAEHAKLQADLYAAFAAASANAADPVFQKAFRQKFQEVRDQLSKEKAK